VQVALESKQTLAEHLAQILYLMQQQQQPAVAALVTHQAKQHWQVDQAAVVAEDSKTVARQVLLDKVIQAEMVKVQLSTQVVAAAELVELVAMVQIQTVQTVVQSVALVESVQILIQHGQLLHQPELLEDMQAVAVARHTELMESSESAEQAAAEILAEQAAEMAQTDQPIQAVVAVQELQVRAEMAARELLSFDTKQSNKGEIWQKIM
jgi:hypothetical protein